MGHGRIKRRTHFGSGAVALSNRAEIGSVFVAMSYPRRSELTTAHSTRFRIETESLRTIAEGDSADSDVQILHYIRLLTGAALMAVRKTSHIRRDEGSPRGIPTSLGRRAWTQRRLPGWVGRASKINQRPTSHSPIIPKQKSVANWTKHDETENIGAHEQVGNALATAAAERDGHLGETNSNTT